MGVIGKPADDALVGAALKSLATGKAKLSLIGQPSVVIDSKRAEMRELEQQWRQEEVRES